VGCRQLAATGVRRSIFFCVDVGVRLGLALRGSETLESLEEFFLAHPVGGHLGVVRVDAGTGGADQRNSLRLGLVDFYIFLQGMNQLFL
jgi:hypothetical protein